MFSRLNTEIDSLEFDTFCRIETLRILDETVIIPWNEHLDINKEMFSIASDWLFEVHRMFKLQLDTFFTAIKLLGIYLSKKVSISRTNLQLYAIVCLMITSKFREVYPPVIRDYVFICDNLYKMEEILEAEKDVVKTVGCKLSITNPIDFLRIYSFESDFNTEQHAKTKSIVSICAMKSEYLSYSSEHLAISANHLISGETPKEKIIERCVETQLETCERITKSSLKAVSVFTQKMLRSDFNEFVTSLGKSNGKSYFPPSGTYKTTTKKVIEHVDISKVGVTKKVLGEGTYGIVEKIKLNGRVCVVKKIKDSCCDDGLSSSFLREVNAYQTISSLGYNGVFSVSCLGFSVENESIFLECANQGSLRDFLKKNPNRFTFDSSLLINSAKQLFRGLDYFHSIGMMIRDIKPENILVFGSAKNPTLKYCDFGMVRGPGVVIANNNAFTHEIISLWYRPIEVLCAKGDKKYGPSVDVWSLSCVVHEMMTGKPLFTGYTEDEQIAKILTRCGCFTNLIQDYDIPEKYQKFLPFEFPFSDKLFSQGVPDIMFSVLMEGLQPHPQNRITAGRAYEMLENGSKNAMQIDILTPSK